MTRASHAKALNIPVLEIFVIFLFAGTISGRWLLLVLQIAVHGLMPILLRFANANCT